MDKRQGSRDTQYPTVRISPRKLSSWAPVSATLGSVVRSEKNLKHVS